MVGKHLNDWHNVVILFVAIKLHKVQDIFKWGLLITGLFSIQYIYVALFISCISFISKCLMEFQDVA
jgi:hypothetical protein